MELNAYGRQLLPAEIDAKEHRAFVGGLWEEIGLLQFEFMKRHDLEPRHQLLDLGCGALRGGIHFIRYLDAGNYYGMDINTSLIAAGNRELAEQGLENRNPHLLVTERFELASFVTTFDAAIAISLFTHLPMNHIVRCLVEVRNVLRPSARLFASYFEAPATAYLEPLEHIPGNVVTQYDADPYHYAFEELRWMAGIAQMHVERIGDWGHPKGQQMLSFSKDR